MKMRTCDVLIIGGGISGAALKFVLDRYTNVKRNILIEKNSRLAEENSHPLNNAQTSHDGGTETNYSLEHALDVKKAATAIRSYVVQKGKVGIYKKTHRMVLGVGAEEVQLLKQRFAVFKDHYPDLRLIQGDEIARVEPKVMEGRNSNEPVAALISAEGFAINYQRLAESFVCDSEALARDTKSPVLFNEKVERIFYDNGYFTVQTKENKFLARAVVFEAGSYSLLFAQELGYGKDYAILPVAGSFFSAGEFLRGKVYRVQIEGMPFAAIHADPDVLNQKDTRFGPTTKPLPLMERHKYKTFFDFIKLPLFTFRGFLSLCKILAQKQLVGYVIKNMIFDLPVIGKLLFLKEARVIVPTIRYRDLKLRRGVGGIRPQLVDLRTGELQMGDATIVGENCIFNTTPSPGASVCLANAKRDAEQVVKFLGIGFHFDKERFERDLGSYQTAPEEK